MSMPQISTVQLKGLILGEGKPKICIPMTAKTEEELLKQADSIADSCADLVEWRVDLFSDQLYEKQVLLLLERLKGHLKSKPLLFTCRTVKEGGKYENSMTEYANLNRIAVKSGWVDLVDIEAFDNKGTQELIEEIHSFSIPVIVSNHEFHQTPSKEEMIRRMCLMQEMGGDIIKLAVMPNCPKDVLSLLCATEEMVRCYAKRPVITMAMGEQGVISRICGETFGSTLTFGTMGEASAPGQLPADKLKEVLDLLHQSGS